MKRIVFLSLIFISLLSNAQDFEYQVLFEGIGDNREFSSEYAMPQTIIGTRGAFELGVSIDEHRLRGGLSHLFEFGTDIDEQKPKLTLYYQFQDDKTTFMFGAFPRRGTIDFPLAMLSDTLLYYRPNIEGLLGKTSWKWGHQLGFVDWVGRQSETQREQFMAGSSGEIFHNNLFMQNYILLFHNAKTSSDDPDEHIEDYVGFALQGGIRTREDATISGYFKAGILNSMYRHRSITDGFEVNTSLFAEVKGRYKNFGLKSVLHSGGSHNFMFGDTYYQADDYLRTDILWYFIQHKNIKATFNVSLHLADWETFDQQQQLSVIYVFGK